MADFGAVYVHILGIKGQCKQVEEKINRISYSCTECYSFNDEHFSRFQCSKQQRESMTWQMNHKINIFFIQVPIANVRHKCVISYDSYRLSQIYSIVSSVTNVGHME